MKNIAIILGTIVILFNSACSTSHTDGIKFEELSGKWAYTKVISRDFSKVDKFLLDFYDDPNKLYPNPSDDIELIITPEQIGMWSPSRRDLFPKEPHFLKISSIESIEGLFKITFEESQGFVSINPLEKNRIIYEDRISTYELTRME